MAISAELGETLEKVVADLVENGRCNSKSEVLREARFRELDLSMRKAIAEADAGQWLSEEEVFDQLEARYADEGDA